MHPTALFISKRKYQVNLIRVNILQFCIAQTFKNFKVVAWAELATLHPHFYILKLIKCNK